MRSCRRRSIMPLCMAQLNHQEIATRRDEDGTAIGDAISLAVEKLNRLDNQASRTKVKSKVRDPAHRWREQRRRFRSRAGGRVGQDDGREDLHDRRRHSRTGAGAGSQSVYRAARNPMGRGQHRRRHAAKDRRRRRAASISARPTPSRSTAIYHEIDQLEKTKVESRHFVDYRELAIQPVVLGRLEYAAAWCWWRFGLVCCSRAC